MLKGLDFRRVLFRSDEEQQRPDTSSHWRSDPAAIRDHSERRNHQKQKMNHRSRSVLAERECEQKQHLHALWIIRGEVGRDPWKMMLLQIASGERDVIGHSVRTGLGFKRIPEIQQTKNDKQNAEEIGRAHV